jgi:elongator complex protein 3
MRLLLPKPEHTVDYPWLGVWTAIIRELHVYGELQKIGEKSASATQHSWLWKKLLAYAENLAKKEGFKQLSVIAGVGVRAYYFKQGYSLNGTYVTKSFEPV